jgi:hypothetical protein
MNLGFNCSQTLYQIGHVFLGRDAVQTNIDIVFEEPAASIDRGAKWRLKIEDVRSSEKD